MTDALAGVRDDAIALTKEALVVGLVGPNHIGWGSDGYLTMVGSPAELPKITEGLMQRGHPEADIRKFWGESYLRVFREVVG